MNKDVRKTLDEIIDIYKEKWITSFDEDTNLKEDVGMDSLDIVEMIMEAENKLGVEVSPEEIVKCVMYGDVIKLFESKVQDSK